MKINRVIIKNHRNLKSVDVILGSIVALIGENNSGKSNFPRALSIPLSSDDSGNSKRLSWYDINREAKEAYS
ncbi:MAG: AAA family ATPase [Clostridia bacterium]|nr:AAA family ATPase [Clostridia bacterium]